jgi:Zn-dependent protease/CBS domain-containing protein
MFTRAFPLFRLFGFQIRADLTWLLLAALITWSLGAGYFPSVHPELSAQSHWIMGVAGMLGLFLSLILHECSHALVARTYGLPIYNITLFLFGGVAELTREPETAKSEFLVAIAGPLASFAIGAICWLAAGAADGLGLPVAAGAVLSYLAAINVVLAVFNLVPAFPLDGGRMLRAVLWARRGNIAEATRSSARAGDIFGWLLIGLGVLQAFTGNVVGGIWMLIIGMFLRGAAGASLQQTLARQRLAPHPVADLMTTDPVTVEAGTKLDALVDDFIMRFHHGAFPVLDQGRPVGLVLARDIREVPHEKRPFIAVGEVMRPIGDDTAVTAGSDAWEAMEKLQRNDVNRLLVIRDGRLAGLLSLSDLRAWLGFYEAFKGEG